MPSAALVITPEDRATLESWTRSSTVPVGHVERARIVMAIADGTGTTGAARIVGVSRPTVIKWRDRFAANGIAGLDDEARPGRPKTVDDAAILAATLEVRRNLWRSLTGRVGCWDVTSVLVMPRWPGRGGVPGSNRGGGRRSSAPLIPSWRPRSATWSGCI